MTNRRRVEPTTWPVRSGPPKAWRPARPRLESPRPRPQTKQWLKPTSARFFPRRCPKWERRPLRAPVRFSRWDHYDAVLVGESAPLTRPGHLPGCIGTVAEVLLRIRCRRWPGSSRPFKVRYFPPTPRLGPRRTALVLVEHGFPLAARKISASPSFYVPKTRGARSGGGVFRTHGGRLVQCPAARCGFASRGPLRATAAQPRPPKNRRDPMQRIIGDAPLHPKATAMLKKGRH